MTRTIVYHDYPVHFSQRGCKVRLHVLHAYGILKARVELPAQWFDWPEHQLLKTTMALPELGEFWQTLIALPMRQFSSGTVRSSP